MDLLLLFRPSLDPFEVILRASAVYWLLFLLFRFVLRRDAGSIGMVDVLLLVLVADTSWDATTGGHQTLGDGFALVASIAGWSWLMDWAGKRYRLLRRFVEAPPVPLVCNGQLQHRNLQREVITVTELMGRLREHGVNKLDEVKFARLESNGEITVIPVEAATGR